MLLECLDLVSNDKYFMDKQELINVLIEEEALVCDDLEDALIGMTRNPATGDIIAVYDRNKCIE